VSQQEPNAEEMRAALEEQMRHIRVEDVLIQTIVTLINLGARRLGLAGPPEEAGETDLDQALLAIEGARALMPLAPDVDELKPVRDALSQLQMAYVQAEGGRQKAEGGQEGGTAEGGEPEADASSAAADAEREKARSKIWTPPGT
jgi:hypothetical protein